MGMGMEGILLNQVKKGQGETNQRLDALLAEQRRTNDLLALLVGALTGDTPEHSFATPSDSAAKPVHVFGGKNLTPEEAENLPRMFGRKRK